MESNKGFFRGSPVQDALLHESRVDAQKNTWDELSKRGFSSQSR